MLRTTPLLALALMMTGLSAVGCAERTPIGDGHDADSARPDGDLDEQGPDGLTIADLECMRSGECEEAAAGGDQDGSIGDETFEEPSGGDPVGDDPVGGDPVGDDPAGEDPAGEDSIDQDSGVADPADEDPTAEDAREDRTSGQGSGQGDAGQGDAGQGRIGDEPPHRNCTERCDFNADCPNEQPLCVYGWCFDEQDLPLH